MMYMPNSVVKSELYIIEEEFKQRKADSYFVTINDIYTSKDINKELEEIKIKYKDEDVTIKNFIENGSNKISSKFGLERSNLTKFFDFVCKKYDVTFYIYTTTHDYKDDINFKSQYFHYLNIINSDGIKTVLLAQTGIVENTLIYKFPTFFSSYLKPYQELEILYEINKDQDKYFSEITDSLISALKNGITKEYYYAQVYDVNIEDDEFVLGRKIFDVYKSNNIEQELFKVEKPVEVVHEDVNGKKKKKKKKKIKDEHPKQENESEISDEESSDVESIDDEKIEEEQKNV